MTNDLKGPPAELRFALTIKRAATGKEETYEMVGGLSAEQLEQFRATHPEAERKDGDLGNLKE